MSLAKDQRHISPSVGKRKSSWRKGCLAALVLLAVLAVLPLAWRALVKGHYADRIFARDGLVEGPAQDRVAIVFGAAVYPGGRLSQVLRDRVDTAISLYQQGAVKRILFSGDGLANRGSEPQAMMAYALARGVAAEDVMLDDGGRRTYDSCYRASHEFGVTSAVLVTQAFHLPRALFICSRLGVSAVGVAADMRLYRAANWYEARETAATVVALVDVARRRSPPELVYPPRLD
jgi:SanA protein